MKNQNNSLQAKRILSAILAVVFILSVLSFTPVMANATTGNEWTTSSNNENTKFSASPKNGTFVIESSVKDAYSYFTRQLQVKSGETYKFTAEVQVNGFNVSNQQATFSIAYADGTYPPNSEVVRVFGKDVTDTSVWLPISGTVTTESNQDLYISLFTHGEGKATFRNVKFEKISYSPIDDTVKVSQNIMIPRKYDVSKDTEWTQAARNINVKDFNLPEAIGKTTLTYDSAFALVGKTPEEIAKSVKTVGDVLQYMIASRFSYGGPNEVNSNNEQNLHVEGNYWNFDPPGNEQLIAGYNCCCGGMGNTVSYLLQGDYDKVGILRWIGDNHVINWVQTGGKYYVFDFTLLTNGGWFNNYTNAVVVLDRLEDFYNKYPKDWTYSDGWYNDKSKFIYVVAFESGGAMYPSDWKEEQSSSAYFIFPKFAEEKITTIYKRNDVKDVSFKYLTLPSSYNYWGLSAIPQSNINIPLGEITFAQNANVTILDQPKPSEQTLTPQTATPTASKVLVNGNEVAFDAYNINGNNYFKLRDLAYIINGTQKQFEVGWDGANNAISLTKGKPYTSTGGEMAIRAIKENKTANPTSSKIYLDGKEVSFTAYNIDGNNYFKLRDIMKTFDVFVGWDGSTNTITLDTSKGYVD